MTIAACYLSPEGVVLGADSTSSAQIAPGPGLAGYHYFNHNQKLFELGENGTVGVLTWGLGSLDGISYRTLLALLAERIEQHRPASLQGVAQEWVDLFWAEYDICGWVQRCRVLAAKPAFDPQVQPGGPNRSEDEEQEFQSLRNSLVVGFCLAGYWLPDRTTTAFVVVFDPLAAKPTPLQLGTNGSGYAWGAPNLVRRLIVGIDDNIKAAILGSGKWAGTHADLDGILAPYALGHGVLPIRDAVDYVHTCIHSTIKALKFSSLFQICGGPIELAVITSDRKFRWVRHKSWDSAIEEG